MIYVRKPTDAELQELGPVGLLERIRQPELGLAKAEPKDMIRPNEIGGQYVGRIKQSTYGKALHGGAD